MADRDEDRFKPKVGPPKGDARAPKSRFVNQVLKHTSKAGAKRTKAARGPSARPGSRLGRGHVAARMMARTLHPRARRVIIKTRLVNLQKAALRSTEKHLRYIEREGI